MSFSTVSSAHGLSLIFGPALTHIHCKASALSADLHHDKVDPIGTCAAEMGSGP